MIWRTESYSSQSDYLLHWLTSNLTFFPNSFFNLQDANVNLTHWTDNIMMLAHDVISKTVAMHSLADYGYFESGLLIYF